jgi:hypothetical protein
MAVNTGARAIKPIKPGGFAGKPKPTLDQAITDAMRPKPIVEPINPPSSDVDFQEVSRPPVIGQPDPTSSRDPIFTRPPVVTPPDFGGASDNAFPSPIGNQTPFDKFANVIGPGPGDPISMFSDGPGVEYDFQPNRMMGNFGSVPDYEMTTGGQFPAPQGGGFGGFTQGAPMPGSNPQGGQFSAPTGGGFGGFTQGAPMPMGNPQGAPSPAPLTGGGATGGGPDFEAPQAQGGGLLSNGLPPPLWGGPSPLSAEVTARNLSMDFPRDPAAQAIRMEQLGLAVPPDLLAQAGFTASGTGPGGNPLDQTRPWMDNLMAEFERTLNPQWEARQRQLEQSLIGRGLRPGTAAYTSAMDDFNRQRTDAFDQARRSSTAQGLQAQQQFWAQNFAQQQARDAAAERVASLQNASASSILQGSLGAMEREFRERQFNEDTRRFDLGFGEDTRRFDSQFGEGRRQFDEGTRRFDVGLGEDRFRFDTQFGEDRRRFDVSRMDQMGQQDFANLLSLLGFDRQGQMYDNDLINQDFNRMGPWFGMIPQGGPVGIDVQNPFLSSAQLEEQRRQQAAAQSASRSNSRWGALGQLGAAAVPFFLCSREFKDTVSPANIGEVASAIYSLPVDLWRYKGSDAVHLGTYAEEFNKALTATPDLPYIKVGDIVGALIATVQDQNKRIEELEALLSDGGTEKRKPGRPKKGTN